jgi:hypothetical protein
VRLGCWISPIYGPVLLGGRFKTYELIITLIFQFFLGHGKLRVTDSADTGALLYCFLVNAPNVTAVSFQVHFSRKF